MDFAISAVLLILESNDMLGRVDLSLLHQCVAIRGPFSTCQQGFLSQWRMSPRDAPANSRDYHVPMTRWVGCAAILILAFCVPVAGLSLWADEGVRPDGWRQAAPESVGFPPNALEEAVARFTASSRALTSLVVVKDGFLVYEGYWNGFSAGEMTALYSATKSLNPLLMGIAIDRGLLADEFAALETWFSEDTVADPRAWTITVQDVLTLRTGFAYDEWTMDYADPDNPYNQWLDAEDRIAYVLSLSMDEEPGTVFRYQTPASQLIPRILEEATGRDAVSLAQAWLFDPLGIPEDHVIWRLDASGHTRVAACNMVPADLARIGLLMLQGGQWDGARIVSASWIERSLVPRVTVREGVQFGYHWWLRDARGAQIVGAEGYGGQCLFLVPEYALVVVTTGDFSSGPEGAFRLLEDHLLPLLLP